MAFDTVIQGGTVVLPGAGATRCDIGVEGGRITAIGELSGFEGTELIDASGKVVVPGAVDAHCHLGIYRDLAEDTASETVSSLVGGVTTVLSYFRTGSHYLNKTGSYESIFPEVLETVSPAAHTDFGFHLAPMDGDQVREIPSLVDKFGIRSFKYYMFYKGLDLSGSGDAGRERMSDVYDLGHLFEIMEQVVAADSESSDRISLSIHAEQPELIRLFMERVKADPSLTGLAAYSAGRPPLTERLAVAEAGVLAGATRCAINLLHLSSAEALAAATELRAHDPALDVRAETTLHHLALSYESYSDQRGKVNPPIRAEQDREALWAGVLNGEIDWICSDHACCGEEHKHGDLWSALPGFGGSALIYPYLLTEGIDRGLTLERVVELVATNPAKAYGLYPRKGAIAIGADADLAVIDLERQEPVTAERLLSAQTYTPFEGLVLRGWPSMTLLRGTVVMSNGEPVGGPTGRYVRDEARSMTPA
jgi:dihydroorotase-like cyclic amidohydrolase